MRSAKKATTEKIGTVNALLFVGDDAEYGLRSKQPKTTGKKVAK